MKNGLIARNTGALSLACLMAISLLIPGCASEPGFIEKGIARLCEKEERGETLVQKNRQKRLQIADDFHRDRPQASTRVPAD